MTLQEAVKAFDRVHPIDEDKLTIDGEHVGIPYCCDLPVVLDTRSGICRIFCGQCRREIARVVRVLPQKCDESPCLDWAVTTWGSKGPFGDLYAADVFEALRQAVKLIRTWHSLGLRNSFKTDDAERMAWQTYQDHSPEMQPIMRILRGENRRPL